jgi:hypothetical protein
MEAWESPHSVGFTAHGAQTHVYSAFYDNSIRFPGRPQKRALSICAFRRPDINYFWRRACAWLVLAHSLTGGFERANERMELIPMIPSAEARSSCCFFDARLYRARAQRALSRCTSATPSKQSPAPGMRGGAQS